jgi:RHS repeat-associated protein
VQRPSHVALRLTVRNLAGHKDLDARAGGAKQREALNAPAHISNAQRVDPFRYAGGTYDYTSDLIKFGQRWYDPDTGCFTQQDSIETLADPSRANRYQYAGGNPVNYVDPTGREVAPPGSDLYDLDQDGDGSENNFTPISSLECYVEGVILTVATMPLSSFAGASLGIAQSTICQFGLN